MHDFCAAFTLALSLPEHAVEDSTDQEEAAARLQLQG